MNTPGDRGARAVFAVCASLEDAKEGKIRIVLDDIRAAGPSPVDWRHFSFFTEMSFERESTLTHSLTDENYMAVGQAVMARLVALRSLVNTNGRQFDE